MTRIGLFIASLALASASQPAGSQSAWIGAWGYAPASADPAQDTPLPPGTYRYRATLTQQGSAVVLTFSNDEGLRPVEIAHATIAQARHATGLEPAPRSAAALTFSGKAGIDLPVGRSVMADPLTFRAMPGEDVIVSVTFASPTQPSRTNLATPMDFTVAANSGGEGTRSVRVRPYLSQISVRHVGPSCTVVAFGDSITDGFLESSRTTRGWPGRLAERFAVQPAGQRCGVVNMGVSGNRLLRSGRATAGLDRFWRDVASVPNVSHVILLEGINDLANGGRNGDPTVSAEALIGGYRQFIARSHALGIKVVGGTLTPARRAWNMSEGRDRARKLANDWIRQSRFFDGVIDFDGAIRDPRAPDDILLAFDSGDHIHPSDAGYRAMGDAVDLRLFAAARR